MNTSLSRLVKPVLPFGAAFSLLASVALAQDPPAAIPSLVMGPSGPDGFRELFEHPEQWQQTRSRVGAILCADHSFKADSDDELGKWFGQMRQWNLKLELEVGAVKEWGGRTGESTFRAQQPAWDRIQRLGGNIYSLAFDEPLCCVRGPIHKSDPSKTDDYALEETVKFIELVRAKYPAMVIGDIEPFPSIPFEDHMKWINALQSRLAEKKIKGLDFYRLDVDWANMNLTHHGTWQEVKKLHGFCKSKKLPFSLIYWAADYGVMKRWNLADDSTWYVGVMTQANAYASVAGGAEQAVVESWVQAPSHSVPETGEFTFTRSVLDFARKYLKNLNEAR